MVEIKFRAKELISTMHRIDPVIQKLAKEHGADHKLVKERQEKLLPIYTSIAQSFAAMHDTPVRMQAKGVIRSIVPWEDSRTFFAMRLRRRLAEQALCYHIQAADEKIGLADAKALIKQWYLSSPRKEDASDQSMASILLDNSDSRFSQEEANAIWEGEDAEFLQWVEGPTGAARISLELRSIRHKAASSLVADLTSTTEGTEGLIQGLQEAIASNPSLRLRLKNLQ
jgi:acetyl-CoA carboxylase/biotin carboxylase 1